MREIIFRGRRKDNGEWVEGNLFVPDISSTPTQICIGTNVVRITYDVDPETVGQYTGLTDKNGTKIFEGDIVKNSWCFARGYSVVKFRTYKTLDMRDEYQQGHLGFCLEHIHEVDKRIVRKDIIYFANKCEVIGNIHDNPELMKGAEENA